MLYEDIKMYAPLHQNSKFNTNEANMSGVNTSNDKYDIKRIQNSQIAHTKLSDVFFLRMYANASCYGKCIS